MDINRNNYESFFLSYLDRELNPAERQSVEKFIRENADLQKEFLLLQQTILTPIDIVFEPKASLFREEEKRRIVPFYKIRIAAAVAVLILGSWYMRSILFKNNVRSLSGKVSVARKNNVVKENKFPAGTNEVRKTELPTDNKNQKAKNQTAVVYPATRTLGNANKNAIVNTILKDRSKTRSQEQSNKKIQDQSVTQNLDPSDSRLNGEPENTAVVSKKSSSALEIQSRDRQTGMKPDQIQTVSGSQTQTLVLAATKSNDPVQYKNAVLKEQDFQNDNAISVVGLNDRNKAITGFFKKLTKRAPSDENARKLRVSVFQISY